MLVFFSIKATGPERLLWNNWILWNIIWKTLFLLIWNPSFKSFTRIFIIRLWKPVLFYLCHFSTQASLFTAIHNSSIFQNMPPRCASHCLYRCSPLPEMLFSPLSLYHKSPWLLSSNISWLFPGIYVGKLNIFPSLLLLCLIHNYILAFT